MSRGFYSLASPVWSNFGLDRGLPISCFGSHMEGQYGVLIYTHAEVGEMTKLGGVRADISVTSGHEAAR